MCFKPIAFGFTWDVFGPLVYVGKTYENMTDTG